MESSLCPSYNSCQLVFDKNIVKPDESRSAYISEYCKSENENWLNCKRLITKRELSFCPDFVLPDTPLKPDEIIDKFDNNSLNS